MADGSMPDAIGRTPIVRLRATMTDYWVDDRKLSGSETRFAIHRPSCNPFADKGRNR